MVPQAAPVQPVPVRVQVTPLSVLSLSTVTDRVTASPGSIFVEAGVLIETVTGLLEPPHPVKPTTKSRKTGRNKGR